MDATGSWNEERLGTIPLSHTTKVCRITVLLEEIYHDNTEIPQFYTATLNKLVVFTTYTCDKNNGGQEKIGELVVIPYMTGMSEDIRHACRKFGTRVAINLSTQG